MQTTEKVLDWAKAHSGGSVQHLDGPGGVKVPIVVRPDGSVLHGELRAAIDLSRAAPERFEGTSTHDTLASFKAHLCRFAWALGDPNGDDDTDDAQVARNRAALFYKSDSGLSVTAEKTAIPSPSLTVTAIYDYGEMRECPGFRRHRAIYEAPISRDWQFWCAVFAENPYTNTELAPVLEERIGDVRPAPVHPSAKGNGAGEEDHDELTGSDASLLAIARDLGTSYADAPRLLELARKFAVKRTETMEAETDVQSGQTLLSYKAEDKGADGKPVKVPGLFALRLPVFEGGEAHDLPVRLLYRPKNGAIHWALLPYRWDVVFEQAVRRVVDTELRATGITVFAGTAEPEA